MARIVIITESEVSREVTETLRNAGHQVVSELLDEAGGEQLVLAAASQWRRLLQQGEVSAGVDVPSDATPNDPLAPAKRLAGTRLDDIEKQVILSTLEKFKGHRNKTAAALGIGVRTLGMKIKRWRDEGETIAGRQPRRAVHVNLT
jgi:DNA-binding NtrC family response regulator